tara:strand:+ start:351 stop:782 length:432 start_codon:yes stop_codon:yes gene_type:complete
MKTEIAIGSDHGGYELKEYIKEYLVDSGYSVKDFGTYDSNSIDYPDIAKEVGEYVAEKGSEGILICGAGVGMSIAANKIKGIRAALCYNSYIAKLSKQHNHANILCLGGRLIGKELAKEIVDTWLNTEFSKEERHVRRISKIE